MQGNYVRLVGTVKRDATSELIRKGLPVLNFCLEVGADGDRRVFVDCIAYGDTVEDFEGFVSAGEAIEVEGYLSFRTYTDGDGSRKTMQFVHVEAMSEVEQFAK